MNKRRCPLCRGTDGENILSLQYAMFDQCGLDPEFELTACRHCGFVYFDTSVTYDALSAYYSRHLFYDSRHKAIKSFEMNHPSMKRFHETAALISKYIHERSAQILDIGANHGEQLLALKLCGYSDLCGIDMRKSCVHSMREMGVSAHIGTGEAMPVHIDKIDACIMSHTVEHMTEPVRVLNQVRKILIDDGLLYIEVPDAAKYPIHDISQWHKFIFYEHLNHFDLSHLETMAKMCGFEPVELGHKTITHRGAQPNKDNQVDCIYGLFKKGKVELIDFKPELETGNSLQGNCETNWRDPGGVLEKVSHSKKDAYLWGVSQYAQLMLGSSPLKKCKQLHLVDRDPFKQRQTINGKVIAAPTIMNAIKADSVVLLSDRNVAPAMQNYLIESGNKIETHILGEV